MDLAVLPLMPEKTEEGVAASVRKGCRGKEGAGHPVSRPAGCGKGVIDVDGGIVEEELRRQPGFRPEKQGGFLEMACGKRSGDFQRIRRRTDPFPLVRETEGLRKAGLVGKEGEVVDLSRKPSPRHSRHHIGNGKRRDVVERPEGGNRPAISAGVPGGEAIQRLAEKRTLEESPKRHGRRQGMGRPQFFRAPGLLPGKDLGKPGPGRRDDRLERRPGHSIHQVYFRLPITLRP